VHSGSIEADAAARTLGSDGGRLKRGKWQGQTKTCPTTTPSSRVITTVAGRGRSPVGLATACDSPGYLNAAPLSGQLLVNWFGRERSPGLTQKWQRR